MYRPASETPSPTYNIQPKPTPQQIKQMNKESNQEVNIESKPNTCILYHFHTHDTIIIIANIVSSFENSVDKYHGCTLIMKYIEYTIRK